MRIISGEAKGKPLFAPSGVQTRPTSDKIRGALFNIIGARVMDSRVLDLFDLVFLDPPYRMTEAYGDALARLMKADMLSPGCLIVMERHKGAQIPLPRAVDVFDTRQYGDTAVDFAEIRPAEDGDCHDTL